MGRTKDEILNNAKNLENMTFDLAEWRADWYEEVFDTEAVCIILSKLRRILKDAPLLFTFRTAEEGGEQPVSREAYTALNKTACESGCIDLVDVEVFRGDEIAEAVTAAAHANGVAVIGSNHDFIKTPPKEELVERMKKMLALGVDIPKIAVMPKAVEDVLTLLAATEEVSSECGGRPIITMSMSGMGLISRLAGEVFGSAVTFGSAGQVSAPGQIDCRELRKLLAVIHKNLQPDTGRTDSSLEICGG